MDENSKILKDFEYVLMNNTKKTPLALYSASSSKDSRFTATERCYRAQDIIRNVNKQIKDIQKADTIVPYKQDRKKLKEFKKSSFIPISMLPKNSEVIDQKPANRFETQCVSDTQLIDIIDNAEAIANSNNGITQEFESTFCDDENEKLTVLNNDSNKNKTDLDIDNETIIRNSILTDKGASTIQKLAENDNKNKTLNRKVFTQSKDIKNQAGTQFTENCEALDKVVDDINVKNDEIPARDEIISPSPIFQVPSSKSESPLVFDLATFEKFEKLAQPIIEENADFTSAKQLINSQIIGKELFIHSNVKPSTSLVKQTSPVLKVCTEQLKITKHTDNNGNLNVYNNKDENRSQNDNKSNATFLEDEILFSSDEEDEYIHKELQDLPLTCALETSFYEQPDVLDKTMLVGLQESNKSLQVTKESLTNSEKNLDELEKDVATSTSLADLVETLCSKYDNSNNEIKETHFEPNQKDNKSKNDEDATINKCVINSSTIKDEASMAKEIETLKRPDKRKFDGFMTASEKKIKLSDIALASCKRVFRDINLDDDFDADCKEESSNVEYRPEKEACNNSHIDDDILQEFSRDMSILDVEDSDTVKFVGFETASKKKIKVSDVALAKAKSVFDGIDINEDLDKSSELPSEKEEFCGFKTASCKPIKISDAAMIKSNELFKDILVDNNENNTLQSKLLEDKEISDLNAFAGFKTANNKEIKISEQALLRTKYIFKDIVDPVSEEQSKDNKMNTKDYNLENDIKELQDDLSTVFENDKLDIELLSQTFTQQREEKTHLESNKINTGCDSDESVVKSENDVLEACKTKNNPEKDTGECLEIKSVSERVNSLSDDSSKLAFRTANNKPIQISKAALERSKKIFEDIDNRQNDNESDELSVAFKELSEKSKGPVNDLGILANKENDVDEHPFVGFKTANNKLINVSSEALAKSKALFQDLGCDDEASVEAINPSTSKFKKPTDVNSESTDLERIKTKSDSVFIGFQTASNKHIGVSAEALAKSKAIFKDLDDDNDQVTEINNDQPFKGFHTASNKRIDVSSEALLRSKDIFKDIETDEVKLKTDDTRKNVKEMFMGFQTASKKPVSISAEALAKSKMVFKDINQDMIETKTHDFINTVDEAFEGFKTANQKPILVSSDALARSKALFKDIDDVESIFKDKHEEFKGFQTASKKPVLISEEALAKSRKMFEDIETIPLNSSQFSGFQAASNKNVKVSENALKATREIFQEHKENVKEKTTTNLKEADILKRRKESCKEFKNPLKDLGVSNHIGNKCETKTVHEKHNVVTENNLDKLIDTQVINDFEEPLCTEDFHTYTPQIRQSKRSGSPILSCPRAKRRKKFETPYRNDGSNLIVEDLKTVNSKPDTETLFDKNYKKNKRLKLRHLAKVEERYENENIKEKVDPYILNFNLDNLQDFEFTAQRNDLTNEKLSTEDLKDIFLKAVNKKLVPLGWIENHLKLIIWKLLSYEIKFPHTLSGVCTAKNVFNQLKYRYDRELYNAERPAIRKILEKDDVASKTMVLCVAGIIVDGVNVKSTTNTSENVELLLTDGWYCIKASIDKMLTKLVCDGKIPVGCKIVTNGAELMNCEQGVAPWEDTSSVRLKLSGNSTRRARWDARLGYHGNAAILTQLSAVRIDGGRVPKLRLFVARAYPMLYVEKFEDGSTVTRSERLEHLHQVKFESERQATMERLYEEVEKELSDQESQESSCPMVGRQRAYPTDSKITHSQARSLEDRTNRKREKLLQDIQERVRRKIDERGLNVSRNVVALMKLRVAAVEGGSGEVTKGLLSVWKPNDMVTEIVKEGSWIEVMNVVPTAFRYSELQLSAGRQSIFKQSKYKEDEKIKPYTTSLSRKCYHIKNLAQNPTMTTDYNEIDVVGLIFQIDEESNQPFQNIYLADTDKNIICINFWGGLKKFGFQNVLNVGQVVYGTNLQKRAGNTRKSVPHFRVTEFSNFIKTPKNVAVRQLIESLEKAFCSIDKKKFCEDCIYLKNNYSTKCTSENISPYRFNNDHNLTKNKVFIDSPLAKCEENFNLTGLDFESTFKQADTQDMSPKVLQRKKMARQKIARLKMVGDPPPLSPLNIINKSITAYNNYRSPLAQTSVASTKTCQSPNDENIQSSPVIQTVKKSNQTNVTSVNKLSTVRRISKDSQSSPLLMSNLNSIATKDVRSCPNVASTKISYQNSRNSDVLQSSPVFSMNRTFVKNVNPVKLNFSNADTSAEEVVDHFAEEFDGSPPLSLD